MMVEFFSADMLLSVCRYRSCRKQKTVLLIAKFRSPVSLLFFPLASLKEALYRVERKVCPWLSQMNSTALISREYMRGKQLVKVKINLIYIIKSKVSKSYVIVTKKHFFPPCGRYRGLAICSVGFRLILTNVQRSIKVVQRFLRDRYKRETLIFETTMDGSSYEKNRFNVSTSV